MILHLKNYFFIVVTTLITILHSTSIKAVTEEQIEYTLGQMQNSIQTLNGDTIEEFMTFYLSDDFKYTKQSVIIPFKKGDKAELLEFDKPNYISYLQDVLYNISIYKIDIQLKNVELDKYENAIANFSMNESLAIKLPKRSYIEPTRYFKFSILSNCISSITGYDIPKIHAMNCAEKIILDESEEVKS